MIALALALAAPAVAQPAPADAIEAARFFIRKEWYADAEAELSSFVATEDGALDPEAWYLLAQVRFERADLDGARDAAERAQTFARDDAQLQQAASFAEFLRTQFGVLTVEGTYAGVSTTLDLSLDSVLYDPDLKAWLARLSAIVETPLELPVRLGLPAGTYTVNGRQVTVAPGAEANVQLATGDLATRGGGVAQLATLELGVGTSIWLGEDARDLLPGVATQLAVSQPLGLLVVGVTLDWDPRWFRTADGALGNSLAGWGAGARVGVALAGGDPLQIRPSLGYRFARIPGIARDCEGGSPSGCTPDAAADVVIYGVATAHIALAELAIDVIDRSGGLGFGFGVRLAGEHAWGRLPQSAVATTGGGLEVPYEVADDARPVRAAGARAMLALSLAF